MSQIIRIIEEVPALAGVLQTMSWHTDDTDLLRKNTDLHGFFVFVILNEGSHKKLDKEIRQTNSTKIAALLYGITCVILRSSGRQDCDYFMLSK